MGKALQHNYEHGARMARNPYTPDCSIKGCARAAHKGQLCAKHYGMVPEQMKRACQTEAIGAAFFAAKKHHRRQLAFVRKQLSALGERT